MSSFVNQPPASHPGSRDTSAHHLAPANGRIARPWPTIDRSYATPAQHFPHDEELRSELTESHRFDRDNKSLIRILDGENMANDTKIADREAVMTHKMTNGYRDDSDTMTHVHTAISYISARSSDEEFPLSLTFLSSLTPCP